MRKTNVTLAIVITVAILSLCVSAKASDPNLVAHWMLDEATGSIAYDSAGGNEGTIYGPNWTSGKINGALEFDGVDDYITLGSPSSLDDLPVNDVTICAWIYDEYSTATTWGTVVGCYSAPNGWGFATFSDASGARSLHFGVLHTTTVAVYWSSDGTISTDTWHHVAAVWDADTKTAKLYIDGDETSYQTTTAGAGTYKSDASLNKEIGRIPHVGGVHYFNGTIDDVRIYNRALSAEEVELLYYWAGPTPSERAVMAIADAIDEKLQALQSIDAALEKEWEAYDALQELLASGEYGDLTKQDIAAAQRKIDSAIRRQERSKRVVLGSIEELEDAILSLGWQP